MIERLVARRFRDFGVLVDANEPARVASRSSFKLTDVDVAGVARPSPGSSMGPPRRASGSATPAQSAGCARARAHGPAYGRGRGQPRPVRQIDVDHARTGIYVEHFTHGSIFRRLRIGPSVRVGLNAEWAAPPGAGARPASTT